MTNLVGIVMGSHSDLSIVEGALTILRELDISYEVHIMSAHRTPDMAADFAKNAKSNGMKVIIAAAGGAAHLPGVLAAYTTLPVIGLPISGSSGTLGGLDALLAIVQMPHGIPVASVAINNSGNAAILAAQIIGTSDPDVAEKLVDFKVKLAEKVIKSNELLNSQ